MDTENDSTPRRDDRPLVDKAKRVVEKLRDAGFEAYFAGGCVRDMLLEKSAKDYDIATDAIPQEVIDLFPRTIAIGAQFGVIQVRYGGEGFEVATFRSDVSYSDGRRPDEVKFVTAQEDVERRDFTINGLLYDPHKDQVLDFVGGEADIRASLIRAIGHPTERFNEDRLRMMRAIRFAARLNFAVDPQTFDAIRAQAGEIVDVSGERIRDELWKTLSEGGAHRGMTLLNDSGLLPFVLPELQEEAMAQWQERTNIVESMKLCHPLQILAFLLYPAPTSAATSLAERLRFSRAERQELGVLLQAMHDAPDALTGDTAHLKRYIRQAEFEGISVLLDALNKLGEITPELCEEIQEAERKFTQEDLFPAALLNGGDLQALGYKPGPLFKEALLRLENAQLNEIIRTRDEAEALMKEVFETP